MERIKLFDGVHLNIIPSDKFKTDYLSVNYIIPLKKESAAFAALLPRVLKRGCQKYPSISALNEKLDFLYSTNISAGNYKRGEMQIISFTCDFLRNSLIPEKMNILSEVTNLLFEILYNPLLINGVFKSDILESEKKNLIETIEAQINNKNSYALQKCISLMCQNEAYGICELGTVCDVKNITSYTLINFYKEVLETARVEVFFNGICKKDALVLSLTNCFSVKPRNYSVNLNTVIIDKSKKVTEHCEEMEVNQGKLTLGFRTPYTLKHENYSDFTLFNEVFGSSPTSKLFENVREKLSLCYYCRSTLESHKGILLVSSGIEVENKIKAQNEILLQLDNIRNGIITDDEIFSAKKSVTNAYKEIYDNANSICVWHLSRILVDDFSSPIESIDKIQTVTKKQISNVAKNITLDTIYFLKGTLKNDDDGMEEEI